MLPVQCVKGLRRLRHEEPPGRAPPPGRATFAAVGDPVDSRVSATAGVAPGGTRVGVAGTSQDGRVEDLLPPDRKIQTGVYRLSFETEAYFKASGGGGFYPSVSIDFHLTDPSQHYHVPLLLSPYGYSTYRGS